MVAEYLPGRWRDSSQVTGGPAAMTCGCIIQGHWEKMLASDTISSNTTNQGWERHESCSSIFLQFSLSTPEPASKKPSQSDASPLMRQTICNWTTAGYDGVGGGLHWTAGTKGGTNDLSSSLLHGLWPKFLITFPRNPLGNPKTQVDSLGNCFRY